MCDEKKMVLPAWMTELDIDDVNKVKYIIQNGNTIIEQPIPQKRKDTTIKKTVQVGRKLKKAQKNNHILRKKQRYSPHTIEEIRQIANERGGKCLSTAYIDIRTKLEFECSKGHKWMTTPMCIYTRSWCPHCAGQIPYGIEEMQRIANERGGKCLSAKYAGKRTKLEFECSKGHHWWAVPNNIKKNGTWCPYCRGLRKTIEDIHKAVESRGFVCISPKYVNALTKLQWECSKGHRWWAVPNNVIKHGTGCPVCARRGKSINQKLLEKIYQRQDVKDKLKDTKIQMKKGVSK